MPLEIIDEYEIEYEGVLLPQHEGWGAYVTVYGPSHNPMHMNAIYPRHHVSFEKIFPNEQLAEAEARRVALELVHHHRRPA
ncbi:hypothetical protein EDC30_104205 [Paucimonas lemoignei]|uniref:Uncharacterized protein n=1 Tax=Paucimonas lemoignei TaxID=29443 RepID=A0A4R3HW78_PAULE|nr:hypothetical protein [Paucimonas lemoignei]TCS37402.1 hypothetical protein EDC30_104205 [Paucimonas lemoignei]